MKPKALSPVILAAIRKLDAAHVAFFAVLEREGRKKAPSPKAKCRMRRGR